MSETPKILVRNARDQDIPTVAEIDTEAFSPYGTAEKPETFQLRLEAFPDGFIILVADNEIAAYGCSEKWSTAREPGLDQDPLETHQPGGRALCITGIAARTAQRRNPRVRLACPSGLRLLSDRPDTRQGEV